MQSRTPDLLKKDNKANLNWLNSKEMKDTTENQESLKREREIYDQTELI